MDILPNYRDVEYPFTVKEGLRLSYADGIVAELRASLATPGDKSAWEVVIRLFKESPYIEVEHIVDWDEKHRPGKGRIFL